MCGRFTLKTPAATIGSLFPEFDLLDLEPRFNIAPTQDVACVRVGESGASELAWLRWGLVPFWAKDLKIGAKMINARSETVDSKPSFRNAFKQRRCLVISDGYFEWKKMPDGKQPFYITATENAGAFCMAGLWELWTDKSNGQDIQTCTVLTTDANNSLGSIHDRMPVVIGQQDREFWLDNSFCDTTKLKSLLKPAAEDFFESKPVDRIVNNARNDGPQCIQPVSQ